MARLEKQIEVQQKEITKLIREAKETKRNFGEGIKEKNELNQLLDELNNEQDTLRSQLETANISR